MAIFNTEKPLIEFETFGGYIVKCSDEDELTKFIKRERSSFNNIINSNEIIYTDNEEARILGLYINEIQEFRAEFLEILVELKQRIKQQGVNVHTASNPAINAKNKIKDLLFNNNFIASQSSAGSLIIHTNKIEEQKTTLLLYVILVKPNQIFSSRLGISLTKARGIYNKYMHIAEAEPNEELSQIDIEKMATTQEKIHLSFKNIEVLNNKFESLEKKIDEAHKKSDIFKGLLSALEDDSNDKIDNLTSTSETRIENYTSSQIKAVELSPSRTYWNNKHTRHKRWTAGMITSITSTIAATVFGFYKLAPKLTENGSNPILDFKFSDLQIGLIGISIFIISTIVWVLRFQSKVLVSHLHRAADATERVTMIDTYLSLIAEDSLSKLNEQDMQLILQVIFRPTVDGFVKDDGPGFQFNIPNVVSAGGK